jgi:hypothetical protein
VNVAVAEASVPLTGAAATAAAFPAGAPRASVLSSPDEIKRRFALIVVGAAVFGAVLGAHRGGVQILYAAIKLPLVVLLTAVVCTPVLTSLNRALGRRAHLREDLGLILASLGRGCLVLVALAPVQLLAALARFDYHRAIMLTVACCSVAGLAGLAVLVRGLWQGSMRVLVTAALLGVFALAGTRMTWTLRPYLVRPCEREVPFLRAVDGSFTSSVGTAMSSAQGRYRSETCPDRTRGYGRD